MTAWQSLQVLPVASVERLRTSLRRTALQCASWTLIEHMQKRLRRRLPVLVEQPRHMNAMSVIGFQLDRHSTQFCSEVEFTSL